MRIKLLRNLGGDYPPYKLDDEVDADDKLAKELVARGLAEVIKGVPKSTAIHGVPPSAAHKSAAAHEEEEDSPVVNEAAHDAIDRISRMRSKHLLQEIVDTDERVTVVEAAKKRLGEI